MPASAASTTGAAASTPEPADDVLDCMAGLAPREMRRAWMTAFGNARLDGRDAIALTDLPAAGHAGKRGPLGFMN
jgi:ATP-dependent Lon protease